MPDELSLTVIY